MKTIEIPSKVAAMMEHTGFAQRAADGVLELTQDGIDYVAAYIARESCRLGQHDFQRIAGVDVCRRPGCKVQVLA